MQFVAKTNYIKLIKRKVGKKMGKIKSLARNAKAKMNAFLACTKAEVKSFIKNEDGDTNFISILVLLGIALALAGIFLTFKEQIITWTDGAIGDFFGRSGGR